MQRPATSERASRPLGSRPKGSSRNQPNRTIPKTAFTPLQDEPTEATKEAMGDSQMSSRPHSPELPSINERLAYLRPSRELLEYYRKKIAEYDDEHEDMLKRLEQYRLTYEEQHKMQWDVRQREDEISELQKALSDMQVYLFQEREHVLRLYAENDRLKIRELEDRKKIQTLLQISGITESEISYFLKEPPAKAIVEQQLPARLKHELAATLSQANSKKVNSKKEREAKAVQEKEQCASDLQTLQLQVEALQAQLQEQTKLAKEQIEALTDELKVKAEEDQARKQRDTDKIQTLTEKLHKTQELLYDSTQDFLNLKYQHRGEERKWMGERDHILRELDVARRQIITHFPSRTHDARTQAGVDHLDAACSARSKEQLLDDLEGFGILDVSGSIERRRIIEMKNAEIDALGNQMQQAQKLADMYREQVMQMEDQLGKIREEGDVGKDLFKERSEKMAKRLQLMNQRYQDLERRRNLEVEGFKTDIKQLRGKLKDLEKQLYKVSMGLVEDFDGRRPDDIDMQILRNVRKTAGRSQHLVGELRLLKNKVFGIENDLRHL